MLNPDPDSSPSHSSRVRARWLLAAIAVIVASGGALLWRFTPLAEWADAHQIATRIGVLRNAWWAPFAVLGLYVIGGLIMFPVTLMIAATALLFEPGFALAMAFTGVMANCAATYAVGAKLARETMRAAFGNRVQRVNAALAGRGVIAVAVVRNIPVAPFTLVNIAMGAVGVRLRDYLIGTALGLAPGIVVFTLFGHQLRRILDRPNATNITMLILAVAGWIGLSLLLQYALRRRRSASKS